MPFGNTKRLGTNILRHKASQNFFAPALKCSSRKSLKWLMISPGYNSECTKVACEICGLHCLTSYNNEGVGGNSK
ncbi:hypothetical protein L1887_05387 [Cichorium endivia]|nr:hypothetical protein L1887_05387 [Cichorium endivia]